jgi:hypothetical protein
LWDLFWRLPQTRFPRPRRRRCNRRKTKSEMDRASNAPRQSRRLLKAPRREMNKTRWLARFERSCVESNPSLWFLVPDLRHTHPSKPCVAMPRFCRKLGTQRARTMRKCQWLRSGVLRISLGIGAKQHFAADGLGSLRTSQSFGGARHVGQFF